MKGILTPLVATLLLTVGSIFAVDAARADDAPLEAFFGKYEGSGITRVPRAYYMGLMDRDMDVEIGPEGNGFFVAWTTVFRRHYRDEELRRKSARVAFVPSKRPSVFLAKGAAERIDEGLSWASIKDNVLRVQLLAIKDDGTYVVQNYYRSLTKEGLFLRFLSDEDGQTIRTVHGNLSKIK